MVEQPNFLSAPCSPTSGGQDEPWRWNALYVTAALDREPPRRSEKARHARHVDADKEWTELLMPTLSTTSPANGRADAKIIVKRHSGPLQ